MSAEPRRTNEGIQLIERLLDTFGYTEGALARFLSVVRLSIARCWYGYTPLPKGAAVPCVPILSVRRRAIFEPSSEPSIHRGRAFESMYYIIRAELTPWCVVCVEKDIDDYGSVLEA